MKFVLLFLFSTCLFSQKENRFINWDDQTRLKWNNFSFACSDTVNTVEDAFISLSISMEYEFNPNLNIVVVAVFDSYSSWTIDSVSKELLQHEQCHFDLCELYARKIRKRYDDLLISRDTTMTNYFKIFQVLSAEHSSEQRRYDYETNHGTLEVEQKRWELNIKEELRSLVIYKDTLVSTNPRCRTIVSCD